MFLYIGGTVVAGIIAFLLWRLPRTPSAVVQSIVVSERFEKAARRLLPIEKSERISAAFVNAVAAKNSETYSEWEVCPGSSRLELRIRNSLRMPNGDVRSSDALVPIPWSLYFTVGGVERMSDVRIRIWPKRDAGILLFAFLGLWAVWQLVFVLVTFLL